MKQIDLAPTSPFWRSAVNVGQQQSTGLASLTALSSMVCFGAASARAFSSHHSTLTSDWTFAIQRSWLKRIVDEFVPAHQQINRHDCITAQQRTATHSNAQPGMTGHLPVQPEMVMAGRMLWSGGPAGAWQSAQKQNDFSLPHTFGLRSCWRRRASINSQIQG